MPTPVVSFQDSFNRADAPLLGSTTDAGGRVWGSVAYTAASGMNIVSNRVVASVGGACNFIDTGVEDGTIYGTVGSDGNWPCLYVREGSGGCYRIEFQATTLYLERESTVLTSALLSSIGLVGGFSAGMVVGLRASAVVGGGTKLTVLIDGAVLLNYTDSTESQRHGTRVGVGGNVAGGGWDSAEFRSLAELPDAKMRLGADPVTKAYLGSTPVDKIYLGTNRVL